VINLTSFFLLVLKNSSISETPKPKRSVKKQSGPSKKKVEVDKEESESEVDDGIESSVITDPDVSIKRDEVMEDSDFRGTQGQLQSASVVPSNVIGVQKNPLRFFIKFTDGEARYFSREDANRQYPQIVIAFYESRLKFP
jgi:hypothetical protein